MERVLSVFCLSYNAFCKVLNFGAAIESRCGFMRRNAAGTGLLIVMFMFVLLLEPLPVHASSNLIQQNSSGCRCTSNPAVVTVTILSDVTSGDVIVVGLAFQQFGAVTPPLTDTRGSAFTLAVTKTDKQGDVAAIYTATLSSSGAETVTVTFTNSRSPDFNIYEVYVYEVAGVTTKRPVKATGTGPSGSFHTSKSISFASESFLLGVIYYANTGSKCKPGTGFTLSPATDSCVYGGESMAEYSTRGVSSPTNFPASSNGIDPWAEAGIALKPSK